MNASIQFRLNDSYELIYVDYRDELTPEQVAMIVRGDDEALWSSLADFESESQYAGAAYVADELLREAGIDREEYKEYEALIDAILARDSSDFVSELASHTPDTLLRIAAIDEDRAYSFESVEPERVLADVGFAATEANKRTVAYALANASPEYSVLMGYWVLGASVRDLYALPSDEDSEVEITNPYLYLGNPFVGSGFITEEPLEGTVRVKRSELRTDRDAFGYSLDEIYGGLNASSFAAKLTGVTS